MLAGNTYPAGTFIVDSSSLGAGKLKEIAVQTRTQMASGKISVETKPLRNNRIALYKSWTASMDAGWISYIFDQYEYKFHFLTDAEIRAGNLKQRFDVIVLADLRASSIINGNRKGKHPSRLCGRNNN